MVSFEIFVKAMPPSLSESKVLPSFCFAFKIPDDRAASIDDTQMPKSTEAPRHRNSNKNNTSTPQSHLESYISI